VSYGTQLSLNNLDSELTLEGNRKKPDELDLLVESLNKARGTLLSELKLRLQAETELKNTNENLEETIKARTIELENAIETLHSAQDELVHSQKMASLGSLVAGISHEINTPLGIGVTSASGISEEVSMFHERFESGSMKKSDLEDFMLHVKDMSDILSQNLRRASELISSFKQVAVDQTDGKHRTIKIHDYVDEILNSLRPKFKNTSINVENKMPLDLSIYTEPGALYQILSNLIDNSLIHGFDSDSVGTISISGELVNDHLKLKYEDTGKGIDESIKARIFDPFFTTKRGQGGSGLGLNITYNLITSTLKGRVDVSSKENRGACFEILLPMSTERQSEDFE
jgi:signal transduction histidine kinase